MQCSKAEAIGILVFIWLWALENADELGRLKDAEDEDISEAIDGITKIPHEDVLEALFETGWMEKIDGVTYIHDWDEWQEQWYKAKKKREDEKLRKRKERGLKNILVSEESKEELKEPAEESPKLPDPPEEPKASKQEKYSTDFEQVWKIYPRHVGKSEAYEKYLARLKDGWSKEQLYEAVQGYASQVKRLGTQEEYIKHPRTFFGPHTPFIDFLKNKGSLVEETVEEQIFNNPFDGYTESFYGNNGHE